ncbi:MAG: DUF2703 domain-containing protein [Methanoregulaceae archaeon]|nr:DUF2703 domain-containing protein [Methanoregulaceae archaeon]
MKSELVVEWRHPPGMDEPPIRFEETGKGIFVLLDEIRPVLEADGIRYRFMGKVVDSAEPALLFNGRRIEVLLADVAGSQYLCSGRRCDPGPEMYFSHTTEGDREVLIVPEMLVRKAVLLALEDE